MSYTRQTPPDPISVNPWKAVPLGLLALFVVAALGLGSCAGLKAFGRGQARSDAHNQVSVTHILIQKAQQQAQINTAEIAATKAEAQKRYQEAVGIRRAQDEISKTLTPLYVQHEAIQAQEKSPSSHTYIPVGPQGIPLVNNIGEPGRTATGK